MSASQDVGSQLWWLLSRSAGVVALVLVSVSVLIGLTLAAGLGGPPARRRMLVSLHEHAAVTGLAAIGLHAVTLLGDTWLKPGLAGISVPFALSYRPVFTGLGIIAGYLAAILGLSFYARRRIGAKRWRKAHRATPVVYVLGVIHTLGAGTDAGTMWLKAIVLAPAIPAAVLLVARLRKRKPARRRAPAPSRPTPQAAEA
jgi:sulfoxide reductase heme-binding subunit YedZ